MDVCSGDDVTVTWCVYLYHPTQLIEMCLNKSSREINATEYAWRLGLDEFIENQVTTYTLNTMLCYSCHVCGVCVELRSNCARHASVEMTIHCLQERLNIITICMWEELE